MDRWTDKVTGCVKTRFEDDQHKYITKAACKILNSSTVIMEDTPQENTIGSKYQTEHDEENSENGNDKQGDDGDEQSDDDNGKHCDADNEYDVNLAENLFSSRSLFLNRFTDQKTRKSSSKCRRSNILVEDWIKAFPRLCQTKLRNRKDGLYCNLEKHM